MTTTRITAAEYRAMQGAPARRRKYGNAPTEYNGRRYHSKAEAQHAARLDLLKRAGEVREWAPQVRFELFVGNVKIGTYTADFVVTFSDGHKEVQDVKGHLQGVHKTHWNRTKALMRACYGIGVVEVRAR